MYMRQTVKIRIVLLLWFLCLSGVVYLLSYIATSRWLAVQDDQGQQQKANIAAESVHDENFIMDENEFQVISQPLFMLRIQEERVMIYYASSNQLYDETDIFVKDLSEELQEELRQGKPIATLQQLYDFLENYSS